MKVLEGIRVLDLSQFLSGPRAAQILSFFGAEVIKIEPPQGDTMRMLMTVSGCERTLSTIHQNKKSIVIDMRKTKGRDVFLQLADQADVIVENFKPGTMESLNLPYFRVFIHIQSLQSPKNLKSDDFSFYIFTLYCQNSYRSM